MPRDPADIPCGGLPSYLDLTQAISLLQIEDETLNSVMHCARLARHVESIEFPRYRVHGDVADNRDLRIAFLLKDLDTDTFKIKLQRREKARARKGEVMDILTMFVNVAAIALQKVARAGQSQDVQDAAAELASLLTYTDECMAKVSERYNCVTPRLTVADVVVTLR